MQEQIDDLYNQIAELKSRLDTKNLNDISVPNNYGINGQIIDLVDVTNFVRIADTAAKLTSFTAVPPKNFYEQIFVDTTQTGLTKDRLYIYDTQAQSWRYCELQ